MLISKFANCNVSDRIEEMEKEYNITLSDQYRYFLCKYNGGYTPKTKFNTGKIFFCDHELENEVKCIAENLKSFLKYCKSEKISEASRLSIKEREEALIAKGRGAVITDALRQMWQAEIDKYENMVQEDVVID